MGQQSWLKGCLWMVGLLWGAQVLAQAEITSISGTGEMTFTEVSNAVNYRVEWAPAPGGPWYSFEGSGLLNGMISTGSGVVTSAVPMCYRVVAVTSAPPPAVRQMVPIPGGINTGTTPDSQYYWLSADTFYMSRFEVTKEEWDVVVSWAVTNGYQFDNLGASKGPGHPVQSISWSDCAKWCNALSEIDGRDACYSVSNFVYQTGRAFAACRFDLNGYRMPTSDEWEYAARGGLQGKRFPWGNTISHQQANYYADSSISFDVSSTAMYHPDYGTGAWPYTSPVGAFPANGYGLFDMAGNVREFNTDNPYGQHELCGGSCGVDAWYQRYGSTATANLGDVNQTYGFRPGTHFDVMNQSFPTDWFERSGLALDVSSIRDRDIAPGDVGLSAIREGMFVAFYSGFIDEIPYGTKAYFTDHPQLSDELIDALLDRKVSIIGIDFAGLRRGAEHTPKDQACADRGVFIVENLCNLKTLLAGRPRRTFTAHTYPLHFTGMSGLPCRVAAEI